ncbi:minor capsid protein [Solibacillus sp. CAU 1738]
MVALVGKEALKLFDKHVANEIMHGDAVTFTNDSIFDGLKKMFQSLKKKANDTFSSSKKERAADQFVKNVNRVNRHNLEQQMKVKGINLVATEPWLKDFMQQHIKNNVGYIKNIEIEMYERIDQAVRDGVKNGASTKAIRKAIMEQTDISEGRAQFLAVDQAGSILGQMTAERHQRLGIEKFTWDTSGDERVRDSHRELDGKVFSYDGLPTINGRVVLPGEDYRCRCVALPMFEDE